MKILLWSTLYYPNIGGLEKMVHTLALALRDKGHDVQVICDGKKNDAFFIEGIPVRSFPFTSALFNYRLPIIRQILCEISDLIDGFSPDVIHIHGWYECYSFYQSRILEKKTTAVCMTLHGLLEQLHYDTDNCKKVWQRAQAVSAVSKAITPDKDHTYLQTIHNGLPLSKSPLKPLPKNRLLLIGRLTEEKCYSVAFRALKILLETHPDVEMTLVGDGPDYQMLLELKTSLNLPIRMEGFVEPSLVEEYIDRASLILVPSSYESFSLAALEAALRARPVVASSVLGLKEVIEDQKTGILVEPNNPHTLAKAASSLLSNPSLMEEMGKAAYERACELFTLEVTVTKYLKMYEKALSNYSCA
jgi:glycogen synthase